jgi:predicted MPP superfamily phosphohydrolase
LDYWVLQRLHALGYAQPLLGFLNGLDHVVQAPGLSVANALRLRSDHHTSTLAWGVSAGVNLPVYWTLGWLAAIAWQRTSRPWSNTNPSSAIVPTTITRRRFLTTGVTLAGGTAVAGFAYAWLAEPRWFTVTRQYLFIRGLPAALDGLRAVQLTDIHHGPWLSLKYVRQVVEASNALKPDLVFLTGDYVHRSKAYIRPVIEELARLQAKIATVAVLGNHDWWEDAALTRQVFQEAAIPLLDNAHVVLTPERRLVSEARTGLALCGIGDLWYGAPNYHRALGSLPASLPRLLLSHNPDAAEERKLVRSGLRVDWMICGHTHGGQIYLPGLGTPIIPSAYGQKYAQGVVQGPMCPVFISRGIGVSMLPLRFGVSPEIAVLELRPADTPP